MENEFVNDATDQPEPTGGTTWDIGEPTGEVAPTSPMPYVNASAGNESTDGDPAQAWVPSDEPQSFGSVGGGAGGAGFGAGAAAADSAAGQPGQPGPFDRPTWAAGPNYGPQAPSAGYGYETPPSPQGGYGPGTPDGIPGPSTPGAGYGYGSPPSSSYGQSSPYGSGGYAPGGYGAAGYGTGGYGAFGHQAPFGDAGSGMPSAPATADGAATRKAPVSRRIVAGGAAAILLAGGIGVGVAIGLSASHHNTTASNGSTGSTIPGSLPTPRNSSSNQGNLSVGDVVKKVEPGVVDITSTVASLGEQAAGTGMILTSNGEVLTNNHVIANANKITAQIDGAGRTYQVRVLGADPSQDVALVQLVGASGLKTVQVGNSADVQVGQSVVAIGNALDLQGSPTVTAGIISALNRSITASDVGSSVTEHLSGLLQTSAQINPGNSGGPLANSSGQVIGMNTASANGSSSQSATSIGFAIPINTALAIAEQIQHGQASSTVLLPKGIMGVEVLSIAQAEAGTTFQQLPTPAVSKGAYVWQAVPGDPAASAGMTQGDVITKVNGNAVTDPTSLGTIMQKTHPGQSVTVTWVDTSGTTHTASLTLVSSPLP
jgi:S1-C subfamily serine protease